MSLASRADTAIRRAWRSFAHLLQNSNYPNVTEKKAPPTAASGAVGQTWRPVDPTSRSSAFCHNGTLPDVMAITFYLLSARASEQPFRRARCGIVPTSPPPSSMQWHRWFAWRPVIIYSRAGRWRVAWLQDVDRRWSLGITSGLGPRWVYRRFSDQQER